MEAYKWRVKLQLGLLPVCIACIVTSFLAFLAIKIKLIFFFGFKKNLKTFCPCLSNNIKIKINKSFLQIKKKKKEVSAV